MTSNASKGATELENSMKESVSYFSVARSLRISSEDIYKNRFKIISKIIDAPTNNPGSKSVPEVASIVEATENKLRIALSINSKLLSLTSKLLWVRWQGSFRIYDKQARVALKLSTSCTIQDFFAEWQKLYLTHQMGISEACLALEKVRNYYFDPDAMSNEEFHNLIESEWFKQRVFDIYIWELGR
ncbi:hypothetical protein [Polycyclovorans algicola]|uniref:hypothetical protein n=1 Tax=Polycyclovorans algicola TaxID=616992 RepID=UPI0012687F98|nr:hypothetical protein [Polycyclovorans algicola]